MFRIIRMLVAVVFRCELKEDVNEVVYQNYKKDQEISDLKRAARTIPLVKEKAEYDQLNKFLPILAERGRRVFGNLKQMKPKTVRCAGHLVGVTNTLLEPAQGGGCFAKVYVVDTKLDLQCLHLVLFDSSGTTGWTDYPDVIYKGLPVLHGEQVSEVLNG
jgi:hypothetical protein